MKARDWIAVHQHLTARGNQRSEVYFNGVAIHPAKVRKEIARNLRGRVKSQVQGAAS